MRAGKTLRELLAGKRALVAPAVFNPEQQALHRTIGMDEMLAIERATVEE